MLQVCWKKRWTRKKTPTRNLLKWPRPSTPRQARRNTLEPKSSLPRRMGRPFHRDKFRRLDLPLPAPETARFAAPLACSPEFRESIVKFFYLLLGGLATFRLSLLISKEDGPGYIFR